MQKLTIINTVFNFYIPERNSEGMKLRDFNKSIIVILISEEDEIKSPQKDAAT